MKFLAILCLATTFGAASAMACPDLTGTYQCEKDSQDPNDSGIVSIATVNGGYSWTDNDDPSHPSLYPTDGKTYNMQDGGTYVGSCTDTFNVVIHATDPQYGPYTMNLSMSQDAATNLSQKGTISLNGNDYPIDVTCTRIN